MNKIKALVCRGLHWDGGNASVKTYQAKWVHITWFEEEEFKIIEKVANF